MNPNMDELERANLKKAWADIAFMMIAFGVAQLLNSLGDDEPDDLTAQWLAYMGTRIDTEATSYVSLFSILDILKSPSAGINQLESLVQFSMFFVPTYEDEEGWNWRFNDELERGAYKDKQQWEKFMIKRSFLKPFYEVSNIEAVKTKNRYLRQIGL